MYELTATQQLFYTVVVFMVGWISGICSYVGFVMVRKRQENATQPELPKTEGENA